MNMTVLAVHWCISLQLALGSSFNRKQATYFESYSTFHF